MNPDFVVVKPEPLPVPSLPPANKKRERTKPELKHMGVYTRVVNGVESFVCTYTLRITDKAIFIPGHRKAGAFLNIPCAVAYIENHARNKEIAERLRRQLAEYYDQPSGATLPRAPPVEQLATFCGRLDYEAWIGDLALWDEITENRGEGVDEWRKCRSSSAKKPKRNPFKFKSGEYIIKARTSGEKSIKRDADAVRAMRQLKSFAKNNAGELVGFFTEKFSAIGVKCLLETNVNPIASRIIGTEVCGPVYLIATKEFTIDLNSIKKKIEIKNNNNAI